jgi:periplasmic protein TonB
MAVQILNHMPDAAVNRGEPLATAPLAPLRVLAPRPRPRSRLHFTGRAWFAIGTIAVHVVALAGFMTAQHIERALAEPDPMVVSLIETAATSREPRDVSPPIQEVAYTLTPPADVAVETETITPPPAVSAAITDAVPGVTPPVVESVEYVRAPAPVYPSESSRRRERGTVVLRVLVDASGRPAQVQLERSSGYPRLDDAARAAVQKALFRPYEVNGTAQPAQVLIPIEFTRRAT